MSAINSTETRVKYLENEKPKVVKEDAFSSMNEALVAEGKEAVSAVATQTFALHTVDEATPLEDLSSFLADPVKQAAVINRGLTLFQQQFANRTMLAKDFAATDGSFDLQAGLDAIGTRAAAPRKDVTELLGELDADKIAAILASLPQDKLEAIFSKLA
jgi:hypothetical protein